MSLPNTIVFLENHYIQLIGKKLGKDRTYDMNQLAITFSKQEGYWCKKVYLYTAPPYQSPKPTQDEKIRKASYDKFLYYMKKIPNFLVREGRCQKLDCKYSEKGVDTLMTTDLVLLPHEHNDIKTIIVVTCDTDFVPVLNKLRTECNINVILYYYSDFKRRSKFSMSNHLFTVCDKKVLITKEHFEKSLRIKINK
ncbi:MAG: NYN domain-containing protein [Candidatus Micrarchaeia archaeon]|jgi:uncharacterized LabA/DUF88 family protein